MTRATLVLILSLLIAPATWAAGANDAREKTAADALSDLVNSDRSIKPIYTEPDQVTTKTLLELLQEATTEPLTDDQWIQDPFVHLERDMVKVKQQLDRHQSDQPVQDRQAEIIRKMDVLIEQLEQASKNCSGACNGGGNGPGTNNPSSPMQDSMLTGGPGGQGELRDPDKDRKRWSDLPDKDREKILQSKTDGFPAGYEELLEEYYRRLAETESATPAGGDAAPPSGSDAE